MVSIAAEGVRARWRLARDAVAFVKFRPGTLNWEFEVNRGVKCERQRERESEIVERTVGLFS